MRRALAPLVVAFSALLAAQPAAAIVYGQPTQGAFPEVGALIVELDDELQQWCTGTLIRDAGAGQPGAFLTAAHCIAPLESVGAEVPGDVFLSFSDDLGSPDLVTVVGASVHPRFWLAMGNPFDVGILFFEDPTGITPATVAPVGYLEGLGRGIRGERFTAVGYGTIRTSRRMGPQAILDDTQRRFARQRFLSLQKAWLNLGMNQARGDGGSCYGDSGGPHFHGTGTGRVVASLTVTGDAMCKALDKTYRLDRPWVHQYLGEVLGA